MGLGAFGGSSQMLFGGSGGQDLFQKATWVMIAIFMLGSLTLTLMKSSSRYHAGKSHARSMPQELPTQDMPAPRAAEQPVNAFAEPQPEQASDTQTA